MRRHARNCVAPRLGEWARQLWTGIARGAVFQGTRPGPHGRVEGTKPRGGPLVVWASSWPLMIQYMLNAVSDTAERGTPAGRTTSLNPNGLIASMGGEPFRNVSTAQSKSRSASEGPKLGSDLWRTGPGLPSSWPWPDGRPSSDAYLGMGAGGDWGKGPATHGRQVSASKEGLLLSVLRLHP